MPLHVTSRFDARDTCFTLMTADQFERSSDTERDVGLCELARQLGLSFYVSYDSYV